MAARPGLSLVPALFLASWAAGQGSTTPVPLATGNPSAALPTQAPATGNPITTAPSVGEQQPASAPPADKDFHHAPQPVSPNAPPEVELSPPPDSEKAQLPPGFTLVLNPAFPSREAKSPLADRGRRYDAADVQPYFLTAKRNDARAAFERGHYAKARTLLANEGDALPVRYLRALSALRAEDFKTAAAEMAALAEDYKALEDRCLVHAAIANEELQRWKAAAELYARVPKTSKLSVDARLGLARALRRAGDLAGAAGALEPLSLLPAPSWGRDVGAEALITLADLARQQKDAKAEQSALVSLWARHPLSQLATQAQGRIKGKPDVTAQVTRAEVMIEAHRNKQGLDALAPLLPNLKLPDELACRAHFAYGKGLRKQREHTRAIQVLDPVTAQCTNPDLRARALYVLGSSRSIVDAGHGPKTYETLARDFPEHSFADDALFYAADLYIKNGDDQGALARLDELSKRYPTGDFAAEAMFKSFWIRRARGEDQEAMRVLDQIESLFANTDESYELERARYWRGRLHEKRNEMDKAVPLFEALAVEHPATYYGLMSRMRLKELDDTAGTRVQATLNIPKTANEKWPLYAGPLEADPHFVAGVELFRLGFPDAAASELLAVNRTQLPPEPLRLLVQVMVAAGDTRTAHAIARVALRRDLSGKIDLLTRPVWESAYPNAFRELIEKHCKAADVDPDLLQALMREESALDPKALSWAGALGLTQLMPATAKAVAKQLKIRGVNTTSLLQPDLNIRLGSWQLGSLLKKFNGNKIYAIASYNAGSNAVERWRTEKPNLALDEWVEEIPIAETRGYVKRVLRSFNTYQLLYQRRPPSSTVTSKR